MYINEFGIGDVAYRVFTNNGLIVKLTVIDKNTRSVWVIENDKHKGRIPKFSNSNFFSTREEAVEWLKKYLTEQNVSLIKAIEKNNKILLGLT